MAKKTKLKKMKNNVPVIRIGVSFCFVGIFIVLTVWSLVISWSCIIMSKVINNYDRNIQIVKAYDKENNSFSTENYDFFEMLKFQNDIYKIEVIGKKGKIINSIENKPEKKISDKQVIDFYFDSDFNDDSDDEFLSGINMETSSRQLGEMLRSFTELINSEKPSMKKIKFSMLVKYHYSIDEDKSVVVSRIINVYEGDILFILMSALFSIFILVLIVIWNISVIINILREYSKARKMYYSDIVSQGNNMQFFYDKSRQILKKKHKKYINYAIVDFGLEKYRNYCTCYGMEKGIILVRNINYAIEKCLRKKELIAHSEKCDFALLLGYDTRENLESRLLAIANDIKGVDKEWEARFRMGVFLVQPGNLDIECMFNYSGVALTTFNDTTGPVSFFTEDMMSQSIWENIVESDMQRALDNNEFQVYLQPKYSTKGEYLAGAEALVRWNHPTQGFISPGKFIPIFEKNGFILKLDDFMLSHVAMQQAKWLSEGKKLVPISVNVSRAHFSRDDLAEHICRVIDQYNVPHEYIELELTESSFFDDKDVLINTVKKLKNYGFEISMDDFGAGYSSLNSLKEIPLDVLKIDAEFFRGNDDSGKGDIIVTEVINLAKKLNMRIVAEGIEQREQVDFLADKDCDLIQGFYFAKPMSISDFEERAYLNNSVLNNAGNTFEDKVTLEK